MGTHTTPALSWAMLKHLSNHPCQEKRKLRSLQWLESINVNISKKPTRLTTSYATWCLPNKPCISPPRISSLDEKIPTMARTMRGERVTLPLCWTFPEVLRLSLAYHPQPSTGTMVLFWFCLLVWCLILSFPWWFPNMTSSPLHGLEKPNYGKEAREGRGVLCPSAGPSLKSYANHLKTRWWVL